MTCLQLCVLFNFQIRVTFSPVFMNIFFQVEANPVQMRCQSLYSAVMVNAKLDYFICYLLLLTTQRTILVKPVLRCKSNSDLAENKFKKLFVKKKIARTDLNKESTNNKPRISFPKKNLGVFREAAWPSG